MLDIIQNRAATRKEQGMASYDMGLRGAMSTPQSVYDLAADESMLFNMGAVPLGVMTEQQGFMVLESPKGAPEVQAHYRTDTNQVIAVHPGTYKLRSNGYGPLYEQGQALFGDTCTMVRGLDNGARAYMLFQPSEPVDFGGGQMIPTIGMSASLDSSIATAVHAFAFDPSCTNAFTSQSAVMRTKATMNHDAIFTHRMEIIAASVNRTKAIAQIARIASDQEFSDSQFSEMVSGLSIVQEREQKAQPVWDEATQQYKEAHGRSVGLYQFTVDAMYEEWGKDKARFGETQWAAFSAVQGAEQHHLNGGNSGSRAKRADRTLRHAFFDPKHSVADEAWEYLRFEELVSA